MKKYLILIPLLLLLGCEERYRYPCQDPNNWKEEFCKKPICSANGTCPEDLTPYEKERLINPAKQIAPSSPSQCSQVKKGECK